MSNRATEETLFIMLLFGNDWTHIIQKAIPLTQLIFLIYFFKFPLD